MKQCDVCTKRTEEELIPLRSIYQTDDIKEVCRACERVINDKLSSLQSVVSKIQRGWLKEFMQTIRDSKW